jgi:hypothetical protein
MLVRKGIADFYERRTPDLKDRRFRDRQRRYIHRLKLYRLSALADHGAKRPLGKFRLGFSAAMSTAI